MLSQRSIINKFLLIAFASICFCSAKIIGQTRSIALLTPENTERSKVFSSLLADSLSKDFKMIDNGIADSAFRSANISVAFNQPVETAQMLASSIGCEYFLLIKAKNQRRSGYERPDYFESYAVVYLVNGRNGELIFWKLYSRESDSADSANKLLDSSIDNIGNDLIGAVNDRPDEPSQNIAEPPDPVPVTFRAPIPYKRMKPDYTEQAMIYGVEATVDILVDVGADGAILRTKIVQWAGFGLDESVAVNVRQMNWRPAEINGKQLPMRILLRYNFKNVPTPEK